MSLQTNISRNKNENDKDNKNKKEINNNNKNENYNKIENEDRIRIMILTSSQEDIRKHHSTQCIIYYHIISYYNISCNHILSSELRT